MIKAFMKNIPPKSIAGNVARSAKLSSQHLKKAKNMPPSPVIVVETNKLTFSPVAISIAAILVATLVTILFGSFSSNH